MSTICVTGGREYADRSFVFEALDTIIANLPEKPTLIVHGACGWDADKPVMQTADRLKGADRWAHEYAEARRLDVKPYPARWGAAGRAAGPRRNAWMLDDARPDVVVAFEGGPGTANTIARARLRGIRVIKPIHPDEEIEA